MKRLVFSLIIVCYLLVNPLSGFCQQSEKGFIESFADGIAYVVLKAAWPTAQYESCEFERVTPLADGGKIFKFKINAKSNWTGGPLWLQVAVEIDSGFDIVDIRYGEYKGIWPPGTARKALQAIATANNK